VVDSNATKPGRQHVRVVVAWKARLVTPAGAHINAKVVDLSEGGLGIRSPQSVGDATEIEVWLAVPVDDSHARHQALRVRGQVTFQVYAGNECRIGLRFLHLDDAIRQVILHWIRRNRIT
jgi:c-di-GMP-binding flagellar brake protein YcgR